jgi:quercetin dioxygenase-like cupin family protein
MEQEKIEALRRKGFDPVYAWDAEPGEEDPDHTHPFDTRLEMLSGEMLVRLEGKDELLKAGDEAFIPREKIHYAKAGAQGCRYIVAERH